MSAIVEEEPMKHRFLSMPLDGIDDAQVVFTAIEIFGQGECFHSLFQLDLEGFTVVDLHDIESAARICFHGYGGSRKTANYLHPGISPSHDIRVSSADAPHIDEALVGSLDESGSDTLYGHRHEATKKKYFFQHFKNSFVMIINRTPCLWFA